MTTLDDEIRTLRDRVAELEAHEAGRERAEKVQAALYRIAETASTAEDMQDFYRQIHAIVGELMYADNFYIALYDEERRAINWPYYVDEVDEDWPDPNVWEPIGTGQARGVTAYTLRRGEPVLLKAGEYRGSRWLAAGSSTWARKGRTGSGSRFGSRSARSASSSSRPTSRTSDYQQSDMEVLTFVGQHIAPALARAQAIDETRQRNAELGLINDVQRASPRTSRCRRCTTWSATACRRSSTRRSWTSASWTRPAGLIRFPYMIERGERFPDEPMEVIGFRQDRARDPRAGLSEDSRPPPGVGADQPPVLSGEPAQVVGVRPARRGRPGDRRDLAAEPRPRARVQRRDVRLLTTLAGSLSVALENARLFEETRHATPNSR